MLTFATIALALLPPALPQGGDEQIGPPSIALAALTIQNGNETGPLGLAFFQGGNESAPPAAFQGGTDSLPPAVAGGNGSEEKTPPTFAQGGQENLPPPTVKQHGEEKGPPMLLQVGGSEELSPPTAWHPFASDVDPLVLTINGFTGPGGSEGKGPPALSGATGERGPPVVSIFVGRAFVGSLALTSELEARLIDAGFDIAVHGSNAGAWLPGDPNGEEVGTLPMLAGGGGPGLSSAGGKGDPYVTEWIDAQGLSHKVVTNKKPLESTGNQAWRHGARVNAALNNFPAAQAAPNPPAPNSTESFQTSWTSGGGMLTHTVITKPKPGEDDNATAQRHFKRVNALLDIFPADN